MDHKTEFEDRIALFALGLLAGYELRKIEEHLDTGCEVCNALLEDSELVFTNLPYALPDSPLSPDLEKRILDKIEETETTGRKPLLSDFWNGVSPLWLNLGSALAVALIVFLITANLTLLNRMVLREDNIRALRAKLGEDEEMMHYVRNPAVDVVNLAGSMPESEASGKLLWDKDTNDALLLVSNVPALVPGKTYQFWVVEDGEPHSMGTFTVNRKGENMMEIKCMPKDSGRVEFAVTLEPEGGMPHPTGATYLAGSL